MSEAIAVSRALSPAQILARIKTVAGPGSGLDADTIRNWSPAVSPIGLGGAPTGIVISPTPQVAQRNTYTASLFRN